MSDYEDVDIDYNKPMSLSIWKKMLPFIAPQKKKLLFAACLMLSAAIVDVVFPLILGYVIKHNIEPRSLDNLWAIMGAAVLLMTIQAINVRIFVAQGISIETAISRAIRNAVFFICKNWGFPTTTKPL